MRQILRELAEERRKDGVHPVLEEAELSDVTRPRMMQVSCLVPARKLPYSRQRLGRQLRDDAELNAALAFARDAGEIVIIKVGDR